MERCKHISVPYRRMFPFAGGVAKEERAGAARYVCFAADFQRIGVMFTCFAAWQLISNLRGFFNNRCCIKMEFRSLQPVHHAAQRDSFEGSRPVLLPQRLRRGQQR